MKFNPEELKKLTEDELEEFTGQKILEHHAIIKKCVSELSKVHDLSPEMERIRQAVQSKQFELQRKCSVRIAEILSEQAIEEPDQEKQKKLALSARCHLRNSEVFNNRLKQLTYYENIIFCMRETREIENAYDKAIKITTKILGPDTQAQQESDETDEDEDTPSIITGPDGAPLRKRTKPTPDVKPETTPEPLKLKKVNIGDPEFNEDEEGEENKNESEKKNDGSDNDDSDTLASERDKEDKSSAKFNISNDDRSTATEIMNWTLREKTVVEFLMEEYIDNNIETYNRNPTKLTSNKNEAIEKTKEVIDEFHNKIKSGEIKASLKAVVYEVLIKRINARKTTYSIRGASSSILSAVDEVKKVAEDYTEQLEKDNGKTT